MSAANRSLKTRIAFSSTIEKSLWDRLKSLSDRTRINISRLLDEAIEDLLNKHRLDIKVEVFGDEALKTKLEEVDSLIKSLNAMKGKNK